MYFQIALIATPDNLRHSLATLLAALARDEQINVYRTIDVALHQAATLQLGLLIVDSTALSSNPAHTIDHLHQQWPIAQIVALIDEEADLQPPSAPHVTVVTVGTGAMQLRTLLNHLLQTLREQ